MSIAQHREGPTTARLRHRALDAADAEAFFRLNSHPEVMRHTGEPLLASIEEAKRAIAAYPDFEIFGYGRWATVLAEEDRVIGFCGLKMLEELGEVDIGYRFLPEYWGRGLATEAASACVAFGFETLGLERIIGLVLPENVASIRVLEKIGLLSEGPTICEGLSALRYAIDRERFEEMRLST